ncbi:hypothetical protein BDZ45DRAFT_735677 [Acephala macrosclerotiorum]|nr:hypothetical protein BDZ45DRAFT_735677 [Acephala macrosclerotiorum]
MTQFGCLQGILPRSRTAAREFKEDQNLLLSDDGIQEQKSFRLTPHDYLLGQYSSRRPGTFSAYTCSSSLQSFSTSDDLPAGSRSDYPIKSLCPPINPLQFRCWRGAPTAGLGGLLDNVNPPSLIIYPYRKQTTIIVPVVPQNPSPPHCAARSLVESSLECFWEATARNRY